MNDLSETGLHDLTSFPRTRYLNLLCTSSLVETNGLALPHRPTSMTATSTSAWCSRAQGPSSSMLTWSGKTRKFKWFERAPYSDCTGKHHTMFSRFGKRSACVADGSSQHICWHFTACRFLRLAVLIPIFHDMLDPVSAGAPCWPLVVLQLFRH